MHFAFTPDQDELRTHARAFLSEQFTPERVAELADSEAGWDPASWAQLAELGWLGVTLPEADGGAGLTWVEQAIVFEELGRALYPGPYFSTVALALPALGPEDAAKVAAGEARWSAEYDGLVPDLAIVDRVVTAKGSAPAEGESLPTMDTTRRYGRLTATADTELPGQIDRTRAFTALAAEAVGIAGRALELALEYATTREQFGRTIGVYQAISHPLSDTYVETELSRSLAYWAAWSIDAEPDGAALAAASAKAFCAEKAVLACERAIQIHGGIGFTWEHPLHRYYKRAQWIESFGGHPAQQRAEVAAAILG